MLKTSNLSFNYDSQNLEFPDLLLEQGDKCLVHGLSGTGKSTFLHLLAGLLKPMTGEIILKGQDITKYNKSKLHDWRSRSIGIVLQYPIFPKDLKCKELLDLKLKWTNNNSSITDALSTVQLLDKKDKYAHQLSGGERQRLAILMACIHRPDLVLIDEATSHLDDVRTTQLLETINKHIQSETIVVFVSHDQRIKSFFNRTIEL